MLNNTILRFVLFWIDGLALFSQIKIRTVILMGPTKICRFNGNEIILNFSCSYLLSSKRRLYESSCMLMAMPILAVLKLNVYPSFASLPLILIGRSQVQSRSSKGEKDRRWGSFGICSCYLYIDRYR